MTGSSHHLDLLRKQIDQIDHQILDLINQRAKIVIEVGKEKQLNEKENSYRPEREAQLLRAIQEKNTGPLSNEAIIDIFRAILSVHRELQKKTSMAYLGPEGTFTHAAAQKIFGSHCDYMSCPSIHDVFKQVEQKKVAFGIVPIENSLEGVVNMTLDELIHSPIKICAETELLIRHNLLAPSQNIEVKRIYAHPQALGQCQEWLRLHLPTAETIAVASNTQAVSLIKERNDSAIIASDLAAEYYQLCKLAENIGNQTENRTRFIVLGHRDSEPSGIDKTMILIHVANIPGALAKISEPFAKRQINIALPTSRPVPSQPWHYIFFLDIEGHQNDRKIKEALQELSESGINTRILGSYPKAVL